ncbi:hypothetical protein MYX78_08555, partial [Acidobacteria bacterium AH-259-G07]|nr:hypothetical protein [Acidobacteria bacterium AH-259-G07]
TGEAEELVTVTAVGSGSITGIFKNDHNDDTLVNALGAFPTGVLGTANQLQIFGDINADGTLLYVEYNCDTAQGVLTRSITPISAAAQNPASVLLDNLVSNPGGVPCFQFLTQTVTGTTFVTRVTVTLSTQTSAADPETGAFHTVTSSLTVAPPNLLAAVELAQLKANDRLQPTPPGLPLPPAP